MIKEIVIDIETGNLSERDKEIELRTIKPDGRNKTRQAIEKSKQEKMKEEGLLNLAPIVCIGTICNDIQINFSTFPLSTSDYNYLLNSDSPIFPLCFETESAMLFFFINFLNNLAFSSIIITHNGKQFDLPRIQSRLAYYEIKGSPFLSHECRKNHFDTMEQWGWNFAHRGEEKKFVTLERICASLGIDFQKPMEGSEVGKEIKKGNYLDVILYCQQDCLATLKASIKMRLI